MPSAFVISIGRRTDRLSTSSSTKRPAGKSKPCGDAHCGRADPVGARGLVWDVGSFDDRDPLTPGRHFDPFPRACLREAPDYAIILSTHVFVVTFQTAQGDRVQGRTGNGILEHRHLFCAFSMIDVKGLDLTIDLDQLHFQHVASPSCAATHRCIAVLRPGGHQRSSSIRLRSWSIWRCRSLHLRVCLPRRPAGRWPDPVPAVASRC